MIREKQRYYRPLLENLQKAFGKRLKTVILFGFQARSKKTLNRDHDIFIVVEDLPDNPLERLYEVRRTIFDVPLEINLLQRHPMR